MDQHLLPPYAATTLDLKSPSGKLPLRFPPLPPKSTAPLDTSGHRDERRSGGLCRTIVLCVLALAVCAGFVLLYLQMRDLERQVQELRELTSGAGSFGPFDDEGAEPVRTSHSRKHDQTQERFPAEEDWPFDSAAHKEHTRERRSVGGSRSSRLGGGSIHQNGMMHQGDPSAHVVPLSRNTQQTNTFYHSSAWFVWTDQEALISHASIPLHSSGRYLLAPHSGYYYIYSQVTLASCNNLTDVLGRGHSLYVKTNCGQTPEQRLTYSVTTQNIRNGRCTYDTGYIGGVYYLARYDQVGVKPYIPGGVVQSRLSLTPTNSYFGMVLISRSSRGTQRCYPFPI